MRQELVEAGGDIRLVGLMVRHREFLSQIPWEGPISSKNMLA